MWQNIDLAGSPERFDKDDRTKCGRILIWLCHLKGLIKMIELNVAEY